MNTVLADLDDRKSLESTSAMPSSKAAIDEVERSIKDALPGPLQGLLG